MNDQERENAIKKFLAQDPTLNDQEQAKIRNELLKVVLTDEEKKEREKRYKEAIEATKKEIAEAVPGTIFLDDNAIEKLIEASDQGDQEATKKIKLLFNDDELREYKIFKKVMSLQHDGKNILEAWEEANRLGDTKKAETLKNEIVSYKNIFPTNSYISNSKVANELIAVYEDSTQKKKTALKVGEIKNENVNVIAYFQDDNLSIKGKPLTAYDKAVHTAVASLYQAGNNVFTLQMVYKTMNGITDKKDIKPVMLADIKESIETSIVRRLRIDATEQFKKLYPNKRPRKIIYENYLLPLSKIIIEMPNGETTDGYKFIDCPPLYSYSHELEHVISVPLKLLDTSKILSNTSEVIVFRERLIQRIATMKKQGNKINNNCILYNSLFEYAGINAEELNKTEAKRKRENIKKILDHFITEKFIKSYEEYKNGRAFAGIKINY